jgi:hypothetical protein
MNKKKLVIHLHGELAKVEILERFLHIKETGTVGMEMLYQSLVKLSERT